MFIELNKNFTIRDIEEEFSLLFPYLRISFESIGSDEVKSRGTIEINSGMRMNEVLELFVDELKLFPTFFRKKNNEWINISKDSILTLKEENEIGRKESEEFGETQYEDFLENKF